MQPYKISAKTFVGRVGVDSWQLSKASKTFLGTEKHKINIYFYIFISSCGRHEPTF